MNLGEFLRIVARRWLIIAVFFGIGLVVSGLVAFSGKPGYTAQATLMLDQPGIQGASAGAAMSRLLVLPQTLKHVIESEEIAGRAAKKLRDQYTRQEIMACSSADPVTLTQIVKITACGDSSLDAPKVTQAVVDAFQDWLKERQDASNVLGVNRLVLAELSAPQVPAGPSGFPPFMWIVIGGMGGALLGLLVAFGVETVQDSDGQLQPGQTGLPQIAPLSPAAQHAPYAALTAPLPAVQTSGQGRGRR